METVKVALYHSAPGQVSSRRLWLAASRNQWHQTLLFLSKGEKTSLGATRIVFQHSLCLGSINNNERKPLFLILSPFCVGQCWRKGTWPLGGVLFCQEASLGSEVHLSNVSLIPHHLPSSWWGLVWQMNLKYFTTVCFDLFFCSFPAPLQIKVSTFLNSKLSISLPPAAAKPLAVFLWPLPILHTLNISLSYHLWSLCFPFATPFQSHLHWCIGISLSTLTLNKAWEVLPDSR